MFQMFIIPPATIIAPNSIINLFLIKVLCFILLPCGRGTCRTGCGFACNGAGTIEPTTGRSAASYGQTCRTWCGAGAADGACGRWFALWYARRRMIVWGGEKERSVLNLIAPTPAPLVLTRAVQGQRRSMTWRWLRALSAKRAWVGLRAGTWTAWRQTGACACIGDLARCVPTRGSTMTALVIAQRIGCAGRQRRAWWPRHGYRAYRALAYLFIERERWREWRRLIWWALFKISRKPDQLN